MNNIIKESDAKTKNHVNDLKGLNQLAQEGILGVIDVVDSVHQSVLNLGGTLSQSKQTNGLTGFIYRSIRATTRLSYRSINFALSRFTPLLPDILLAKRRDHWVAVLNGIIGDHLAATDNPLALEMTLVYQDQEISIQQAAILWSNPNVKPLLLIHGLCLNAQSWQQKDHNHGQALADSGQYLPIYLNYNSGLAIADNGRKLAQLMSELHTLMGEQQKINVLAFSMGGLIVRSALQMAEKDQNSWPQRIEKLVFLGTPHQGALLEKTGHLMEYILKISPYSAPFVQITQIRSQGIKDLRQGRIHDDGQSVRLPRHIKSYAIAGTAKDDKAPHKKMLGDGLVTVNSALGRHPKKSRHTGIPKKHQFTVFHVSHLGLLSSKEVYDHLEKIFID